MGYVIGERDLDRATDLRRLKKGLSPAAQRILDRTIDRLQARGVAKLARIGRRRRRKAPVAR